MNRIEKPLFNPEERIRALERQLEQAKKEIKRLNESAGIDGLTGLHNRQRLDDVLPIAISTSLRTGKVLSAFFVDIDNFKSFNDLHGHQAGDNALRLVADALKGKLHRSSDGIYRYGGEEIVALLPITYKPNAVMVALNLLRAVRELRIPNEQEDLSVTVSMGVNSFRPENIDLSKTAGKRLKELIDLSGKELIAGADSAMYAAKSRDKNKVGIYIEDDGEKFEVGELLRKNGEDRRDVVLLQRHAILVRK